MSNLLVNFLFPSECLICFKTGDPICIDCLKILEPARLCCLKCSHKNPYGLYCEYCKTKDKPDKVLAPFVFKGPIREIIHQFKYEDSTSYVKVLANALADCVKKIAGYRSYSIVSVPISKKRFRQRGYNQSKLLALGVCEILGVSLTDIVTRVDGHLSQVQTGDKKLRRANVKGVFQVVENSKTPAKIIIIDDVITTGSTVEEITRILKHSGAREVIAVSVALA